MKISKVEVEVPAGSYVLGDPCYCFPDHGEWMKLLESCNYFENPIGTLSKGTDNHYVVAFSTRWGDGCYQGTNGKMYPVDAGLIGLVPLEVIQPVSSDLRDSLGTVVVFNKPTKCSTDGEGKLRFGNITIDTDPQDDEEDEE